MSLERGPFVLLGDGAVAIEAAVYDFSDDALTLAAQLNAIASSWDQPLIDIGDVAADLLDDLDAFDFDTVLAGVATASGAADLPALDGLSSAYDLADTQLTIAVSFAPSQAWTDPPGPYVPPGAALTLTAPIIPVSYYSAPTTGTVGDTSDTSRPTVKLWNFTRVGSLNFVEGDTFEIALLGNPGQAVTVGGTFNGDQLPISDEGTLDGNGNLGLQGVMSPDVVGAWHEDWYFDGAFVKSFDFIVSPANG